MGKSYIDLSSGHKMPLIGLGTWQATNEAELESALDTALEAGYRHVDTAFIYNNEQVIGRVLQKWFESGKIQRKDLFIVTKLPPTGMRPEQVRHFLRLSLKNLQLDYVDLYLIHSPVGFHYTSDTDLFPVKDGKPLLDLTTNLEGIWKAIEMQVDEGLTKSIGLSNFSSKQIERIMKIAKVRPANLQAELHAYFQQNELVETCKKHNISVCAYAPIGSPGRKEYFESLGQTFVPTSLLQDSVVREVSYTHNKTAAQVLLRFLTQKGIIVIPKSTNMARIRQNFQLNFDLSDAELKSLEQLDKGAEGRTFNSDILPGISDHPEYNA